MKTSRRLVAAALVSLIALLARGAYGGTAGEWLGAARLPMSIGAWQGTEAPAEDPETVAWLGADGMVNRTYASASGSPIALYVAYFERQRPGVTIHSPLHCLPGAGWDVVSTTTISYSPPHEAAVTDMTDTTGRQTPVVPGSIRRLIAQKDANRAVVLYWYAMHGRMVASELASRAYLLEDRIRFSRNDAALVRVVVPSDGNDASAERQGLAFIDDLRPQLSRLWN